MIMSASSRIQTEIRSGRTHGGGFPSGPRYLLPFLESHQAQAEPRIVDAVIAVGAAQHCLRQDLHYLLRHHADKGDIAPQIFVAIKPDTAVEPCQKHNVALEANVTEA